MAQRVVVITGVTHGLGRAMAERCIEAGAIVWGCGRSVPEIKSLHQRHPAPHHFQAIDVTDDKEVAVWARELLASGKVPDLLLNNAAIICRNAPLWELSAEEVDPVFDVNLKGITNIIRHFVPAMVERKQGVIVNFSSGWGRSTSPEVAAYCATKWGVEGLTQALASELPPGMAAVPVNPGIINTRMLQSCFGSGAGNYPNPDVWSRTAVPFLLKLGPQDNGQPLTCP